MEVVHQAVIVKITYLGQAMLYLHCPQKTVTTAALLVHAIGLQPWSLRAAAVMQCNMFGSGESVACAWPSPLQRDLRSRVSSMLYVLDGSHVARMSRC